MEVDFETKKANVTMKPGLSLTREECEKALTGTKYTVASFEADAGA